MAIRKCFSPWILTRSADTFFAFVFRFHISSPDILFWLTPYSCRPSAYGSTFAMTDVSYTAAWRFLPTWIGILYAPTPVSDLYAAACP